MSEAAFDQLGLYTGFNTNLNYILRPYASKEERQSEAIYSSFQLGLSRVSS